MMTYMEWDQPETMASVRNGRGRIVLPIDDAVLAAIRSGDFDQRVSGWTTIFLAIRDQIEGVTHNRWSIIPTDTKINTLIVWEG